MNRRFARYIEQANRLLLRVATGLSTSSDFDNWLDGVGEWVFLLNNERSARIEIERVGSMVPDSATTAFGVSPFDPAWMDAVIPPDTDFTDCESDGGFALNNHWTVLVSLLASRQILPQRIGIVGSFPTIWKSKLPARAVLRHMFGRFADSKRYAESVRAALSEAVDDLSDWQDRLDIALEKKKPTGKPTKKGLPTPREANVKTILDAAQAAGANLTQKQIAEQLGISNGRISQIIKSLREKGELPNSHHSVYLPKALSLQGDFSSDDSTSQRTPRQRKGV